MSHGERDLGRLLNDLKPSLAQERYAFENSNNPLLAADAFALVREEEALTVIRVSATGQWARISLGVDSSLEAVGLTAAFSRALADSGISANVIAALHHDHIFVPWNRRYEALSVLQSLV